MQLPPIPYLVYIKDKDVQHFVYKQGVVNVERNGALYRVTYKNGRSYNYGTDRISIVRLLRSREGVRIYQNGVLSRLYNAVDDYGSYLILRNEKQRTDPIAKSSDIEICDEKGDTSKVENLLDYFLGVLQSASPLSFDMPTEDEPKAPTEVNGEILRKALENIDVGESRSALSNYMEGVMPSAEVHKSVVIYPFGCNESQMQAVETALNNQASIIEGPPGTGKTQTILNIVANLILHNRTIGIVSNNNSAVSNVYEKLHKSGYGHLVATLGNNDNKARFFERAAKEKMLYGKYITAERRAELLAEVERLGALLRECFTTRNNLARLRTELADVRTAYDHLQLQQHLPKMAKTAFDSLFSLEWSSQSLFKLKKRLSVGRVTFLTRLVLLFQYRVINSSVIAKHLHLFNIYLNHKFYDLQIASLEDRISESEEWLVKNSEKENLELFTSYSKELFDGAIYDRYISLEPVDCTLADYQRNFNHFVRRYPIITSSTLSLHTSIPNGQLLDYLIIDESSQVDIIKAAVCLSCSRSVVVVGDSMQLSHIVDKESRDAANHLHKSYKLSDAYNYSDKNILASLKTLYRGQIHSTLLKEHYRCHPAIIGFCNKRYYNNSLVVMTENDGAPFKIIETAIAGGRATYNQRQIDETSRYISENYALSDGEVGVISPYRRHANMLQSALPKGTEADTIHKYQGREKGTIIFNTVVGEINEFVDNANLINVAVSRAVNEFVVVKPQSLELPHGTNIGDLIRYIQYTSPSKDTVIKGQVCSVFDLLYKEYNCMLDEFMKQNKGQRGSAAEIIMSNLLTDILSQTEYSSLDFVREYALRDLVRDITILSEEEQEFVYNNARLDFLIYSKIDKSPVLAIEVDGASFHDNLKQRERDFMKNKILCECRLPVLRLSTDGHSERKRVVSALDSAMGLDGLNVG